MKNKRLNHLKTTVKKDILVFKSEFFQYFMLFVLFPICLGFFYGVMYQNILEQKIVFNNLTIYRVSDGSEEMLSGIFDALESDGFSFVKIEDVGTEEEMVQKLKSDNSIGLTVYFDHSTDGSINLKWLDRGSDSLEKGVVQQFITQAVREANMSINVQNQLSSLSASQLEARYPGFSEKMAALNSGYFVEKVETEPIKALSSTELFLISIFISFSVFFTTGMVKQREKKQVQRAFASGVNRTMLYLSNSVSIFIISTFMSALYFLIVFGFVLRIQVAILPLIGVILLQGLMITGVQSLISGFCKTERTSIMVSMFVLFGFMFLGGGAVPIDSYGDASSLTNFAPNYHVFKLYEAIVLDNPMNTMLWRAGVVVLIAVGMIALGMLVFVKKEEI